MQHDLPAQQVGDKVRIKVGDHKGKRGLITTVAAETAEITMADGNAITANQTEITNYSLAARKAWQVMPKKTGRPKGQSTKKMVSIRLDVLVWQQLGRAVELGLIVSREEAVNQWLRERLNSLIREEQTS